MEKNYINYKDVKKAIAKSCVSKGNGLFNVDFDKLKAFTEDLGLFPIVFEESKKISASDIPNITNYLDGERLEWIDNAKSVMNIIFVRKDFKDPVMNILADEEDNVNNVSVIVANYPCYFALVVGYNSNDPDRCKKLNYLIGCRANKVALREKYDKKESNSDNECNDSEENV